MSAALSVWNTKVPSPTSEELEGIVQGAGECMGGENGGKNGGGGENGGKNGGGGENGGENGGGGKEGNFFLLYRCSYNPSP